jgi:hypothetical protein
MRPSTRLAGVVTVVVAAVLSGPAWAAQTSQAGAIQAHGTQARHASLSTGTVIRVALTDAGQVLLPEARKRREPGSVQRAGRCRGRVVTGPRAIARAR